MSLPKFNKLYFPGLISLVFLPLICIAYIQFNKSNDKLTGITVVWADDSYAELWSKISIKPFNIKTFRKFDNKELTGDENQDKSVITDFQNKIKYFEHSTDTTNGLAVIFTNHTKYEEIVRLIDLCQTAKKGAGCILYKNKILLLGGEPIVFKQVPMPL